MACRPGPAAGSDRGQHVCGQPAAEGLGRRPAESFLEEYNRHMLQVLTIHEGYQAITCSSSTRTATRR